MFPLGFALAFLIPVVGPEIPASTDLVFRRDVLALEEATSRLDFREAERLLAVLPQRTISISWDDSKVPVERRAEFANARDKAFESWKEVLPGLQFSVVPRGRIHFSFEAELPPNADSPGPAGAVYFFSSDPSEPRIEGILALVRTAKKLQIDAKEVTNEVVHSIGVSLGLGRIAHIASPMNREEGFYRAVMPLSPAEAVLANDTLAAVVRLRALVEQRRRIVAAKPVAYVAQTEFRPLDVVQGDLINQSFLVVNKGNAPLRIRLVPDCGCFSAIRYDKAVPPGEERLVQVTIDTTNFPGNLDKNLYLYTNDPDRGEVKLNFKMRADPVFTFLGHERQSTILVGDSGVESDLILLLTSKKKIVPQAIRVDGITAQGTFAPWQGSVNDPENPGRKIERSGYRIKLSIRADIPPGRSAMTVNVVTDDPVWKELRHTLYVQRGIVALPSSLYLGELGKDPARGWFLLTRPKAPFRVLRVESSSPFLKALIEDVDGGFEYRINVIYDGRADFGDFRATLTLITDDKKQPRVEVPIRAVIR